MDHHNLNTYWKTVVDTIQDGVMIVNPQGAIISVNRGFEEITGYKRGEVLGKSCSILKCNSCEFVRNASECHYCVMFKQGTLNKQQCVVTHRDGRAVHIVKNASVLKNDDGEIFGAVETMTDVTDLVEKETQIKIYRQELGAEDRFYGMIGVSEKMRRVFELISNASRSEAPVIIYGESGTGKELVARAIHEISLRKKGPYIKVNCAALNESLLESELFGHVKGAFTGAHRDREGRFQSAHEGDIFLDEIGDLPISTQVKLLRVLEDKVVERVGDNTPIRVDARIISATNRNLPELIDQGRYREDFFYRINVIPIQAPPLRERTEDIPVLIRSFFNRTRLSSGRSQIESISNEALEILTHYHWPGNIRELKSAFEFAFVACRGNTITPEHLPFNITTGDKPLRRDIAISRNLDEIKKQRLIQAMESTGGNQSRAARQLGLSRTSVWNQMKRFNLNAGQFKPKPDTGGGMIRN